MKKDVYDLTSPQKAIWLTEQMYNGLPICNVCGLMRFDNVLDFDILEKSINKVVEFNDSTRLQISENNGIIKQYLQNYNYFTIKITDITYENVEEYIDKIANISLTLYDSPLYYFELLRFPDGKGIAIATFHHLIADAWSMDLLTTNVANYYDNIKNNIEDNKSFPSYIDYINSEIKYINSEKYLKDKEFWNEELKEFCEITTLNVLSKEKKSTNAKRRSFKLGTELTNKIKEFCSKNKTSTYSLIISIMSIYLSKISNHKNIVIGTPILNRSNFAEKNTMGLFIGTMPFISTIDNNEKFINFLTNLSQKQLSFFRHQKYPYDNILKDIRKKNNITDNLYDILISYQNAKNNSKTSQVKYLSEWRFNNYISESLNMHIFDINDSGNLTFAYDYLIDIFHENDINNLHERILHMIDQVIHYSEISIQEIEIISKQEKKVLLEEFNNTDTNYEKNKTIHKLFEEQVIRTPNDIALICKEKNITYEDLNKRANSLSHFLCENGVKNGSIVGIMVNRSIEMIIGILAIIKSGAAYLPIDPEYPKDRIDYMLEDSNTKILLVDHNTINLVGTTQKKTNISLDSKIYFDYPNTNLNLKMNPDILIYLIYTSGSTGKPKGVMLTHKNINNFIVGMKEKIDFNKNKTMLSLTTICFDIFVLEIWLSLLTGMKIIIADEQEQNIASKVNELCLKYNVDMIQTTPSRFNILLSDENNLEYFKHLSDILVGGEPLPKLLLEKFQSLTKANIYNVYGPTETAVWSTVKDVTNTGEITVGVPISNTKVYILNKDLCILPNNVPGELYISGDGVSHGYLNREELTKEKFISSPFSNETLYNTNDLAYINENNELVHLGRTDFQVKLRGYRVELGEIEHKIKSYPSIDDAIIIYDNRDFLICYYTSKEEIDTVDILDYIIKDLPNYMAPSHYVRLDKIPLTPNGKVDRSKLPKLEIKQKNIELASTKTEETLSKLVKDILNLNKVDINSTFLELGIDSLDIINMQTLTISYKWNITTQDFYKYPTIKMLANKIDSDDNNITEQEFNLPDIVKHTNESIQDDILKINDNNDVLGNVFLTGATGFLGVHILHELIEHTDCAIYCLVRGNNLEHSIKRLIDNYSFYFKNNISNLINNRIYILNGAIDKDNFNLSKNQIDSILRNATTFIHCAAIVGHYGDFNKFKVTNINGTRKIAEFAYNNNKRFIHISSLSVSGNYLVKQNNSNVEFSENDLYIGQHYTENVYVNSKLEAEHIVYELIEKGLNAKILRLGIISGRFSDGVFQNNIADNAFYSRIKSIISISAVSKSMLKQQIEFTPVDICAKAIFLLSKFDIGNNRVFHLYNYNLYTISDIIEEIKKFNIDISIIDDDKFIDYINKISMNKNKDLKGIVNDFNHNDDKNYLDYNFSVNIKSDITIKYLNALNLNWPQISNEYINKLLKYMKEVNFI